MNAVFLNRREAGSKLAKKLTSYANRPQTIVLGLPRGGVPVAYEIAQNLNLFWDVCLVTKLGLPNSPETAMGAIAEDALLKDNSGELTVIDREQAQASRVTPGQLKEIAAREKAKLKWRECYYRNFRPMLTIANQTIIIVDDGIATGWTMQAAVKVLRQHQPEKIVVATPVASRKAIKHLKTQVDELVYAIAPSSFRAVSFWYEDFGQVSDREVCNLLSQMTGERLASSQQTYENPTNFNRR